jgi:hypothetical protein
MEVEDTLWDGDKPASVNRVLIFQHRLGVIRRNAESGKFERVPGKVNFQDCLDTAVIIAVKHEKYTRKDGQEGTSVKLEFNGIFAADDAKAAEKVGKPVAGQEGGTTSKPATTPATTPAKSATPASDAAAARRAAISDL